MGLLERIADARHGETRAVDGARSAISITDWSKMFRPGAQVSYGGQTYQAFEMSGGGRGAAYYESNSVVFACELNRVLLFSEARFQFQQLRRGRPGDLFGTEDLAVLEEPWIGHTTRDLLARAELDVACYGNSYWVPDGPYLLRLKPENVKVLTQAAIEEEYSGLQVGERLLGYAYMVNNDQVVIYEPGQIAHYKPIPDRTNPFIGMSWLNPCLPDIDADEQFTEHKRSHMRNGAAIPFVISYDQTITPHQFDELVRVYEEHHAGPHNSGKPLHIGGGADVKTVGQTFENLSLKATQGAGETRIAACAGVPPVIVGLSEGLSSATYSNYSQARRRLVDGTMRPLWGAFASAFQSVVRVPLAARLWYDDRDIPFLREDVKDQAAIFAQDMQSVRTGVDAGFEGDAVIRATAAKDINLLLGQHSGLFSVQLQPPMPDQPTDLEPAVNGNGSAP